MKSEPETNVEGSATSIKIEDIQGNATQSDLKPFDITKSGEGKSYKCHICGKEFKK